MSDYGDVIYDAASENSNGVDSYDEELEIQYYNNKFRSIEEDESTLDSNKKKHRKMIDDAKKADKGYNKITRIVNHKKQKIELYSTNITPGTAIRNAVTGCRFREYRVGTLQEHLFFKVSMVTGEMNKYSSVLFFDNPEQYERHMKTEVSQEFKEQWEQKAAEVRNMNYVPKNLIQFTMVR
jgi:hypothetical protein